ncbi:MAG: insulinase family protein [Muribaculaceae bacterium]|nr:insulinase family protein [Muribaculaceae bacterium]
MKKPDIFAFDSIYIPKINEVRLDNGVLLRISPYESSEICRFQIIMRGGTLDFENPMIYRITALSMFRGTENMSADYVASQFDYYGVNIEKRVATHHTIFDFTVLKRFIPHVLPIISESIAKPVFEENYFEILKRNQAQAISQIYERPQSLALIKFKELAYSAMCRIGKSATPNDSMEVMFDEITGAHHTMINNGIAIIASGDISEEIIQIINHTFGTSTFSSIKTHIADSVDNNMPNPGVTTIINRDNAVQSSIVMGMQMPRRTEEDFIDTRIACCLLGGFFGSRLMQAIREEDGLTYGISSHISSIDGTSRMMITTDCNIGYTTEVKESIIREIEKMRNVTPDTNEVNILKSYLLSQYARMIDKSMAVGEYLTSQISMGIDNDFFNRQVHRTKEITPNEILEISQKYFIPENILSVIVTNKNS